MATHCNNIGSDYSGSLSDSDEDIIPTSVHLKFDVESAQLLPLMAK